MSAGARSRKRIPYQLPPLLVDLISPGDGLHKLIVRDAGLWYPNSAQQVCPFAIHGLLESASFVWAKNA